MLGQGGRSGWWLARVTAAGLVVLMGGACAAIVGFESEYEVVAADAGIGIGGVGGAGGAGGGVSGGQTGGAAGAGGSTCAHSTCAIGPPLEDGCDECVTDICEIASYCCTDLWDPICVSDAQQKCGAQCCGDGWCAGTGNTCGACPEDCTACTCPHSVCTIGAALSDADCKEPCVNAVCADMPQCCGQQLGFLATECIEHADTLCPPDPCVAMVCGDTPSCCTTSWDQGCVDLAKTLCMEACDCVHPLCVQGPALVATCDPCVAAICALDTYCCMGGWDPICVLEVTAMCGLTC